MKILGLDTSTNVESAAIVKENEVLCEKICFSPRLSKSRKALSLIDFVLKESHLNVHDIAAIAVTIGPGSFTGLRTGLALCKGIAAVIDKPIIPISTLDALVHAYQVNGRVVPLLDARRKEVYAAIYSFHKNKFEKISEEMAISVNSLCKMMNQKTLFLGEGALRYQQEIRNILGDKSVVHAEPPKMSVASGAALLSLPLYAQKKFEDFHLIKPEYIRRSQAERTG